MTRKVLTLSLVVVVYTLTGCNNACDQPYLMAPDVQIEPDPIDQPSVALETESIDNLITFRLAYQKSLMNIVQYYQQTGDNMKLEWAKKELEAFCAIPKYSYIVQAEVAGPELKAFEIIYNADILYSQALKEYNNASTLGLIIDCKKMRLALNKFNQLIQTYPTSDKIDDAAYKAAGIYEYFKDYEISLLYYMRTFQWDENTPYPARYKTAFTLDRLLRRRAESIPYYKMSLEKETKFANYNNIAKFRLSQIEEPKEVPMSPESE